MKKGFTLIELIAVIFILALVMLIVTPIINDNILKSKTNLNTEQIRQIESSARQWGVDNLIIKENKPALKNGTSISSVSVRDLQTSGYLDDKTIVNILTKEELGDDKKVCITYENNQFIYEYEGGC